MKLVDDIAYEVECKMVTIKKGADVGRFQAQLSQSPLCSLKIC